MESTAALLLLLGVVGCCRGLEPIAVCSGSDVTFRAAASARPLEINWFKDSSKIVEVEEGKDPFYFTCQGRCIVNLPRRTLIVTNVTAEDSGSYRAAVLVGGTLEDTNFRLQVDDPVCNVTIRNTTVQNNVTLQCVCSSSGAAPAKCEWYKWDSGNYRSVSDGCSITVHKEEKPQQYECVAFNGACNNSATFTVPGKEPAWNNRYQKGPSLSSGKRMNRANKTL
ncbi:titin-like [Eleutherodactylus coqui]|uniref:titin-like n=1 Tax=Eleutherodactylus coqui TaxID=57060 RepID=UPI003462EFCC